MSFLGRAAALAATLFLLATPSALGATNGVSSHGQSGSTGVAREKTLSHFWSAVPSKQIKPVSPPYTLRTPFLVPHQFKSPGPPIEKQGVAGSIAGTHAAVAPLLGSVGTPWSGSQNLLPATTTGKVFFTDHAGGQWVCSGSLVNSAGKDLVITAGHCVFGTAGGELPAGETWHSNWVFAPDYNNGVAPYGYWSARQLWTMTNYMNSGDEQDDMGAAILNTVNGQHAVDLLGGQGIAWNQSPLQSIWDFGYPAAAPFNGQIDEVCNGNDAYDIFIEMEVLPCNFTGGSSGGPWLMQFGGEFGYVNGVNDARYSGLPADITSMYFGNNAGALYNATNNL